MICIKPPNAQPHWNTHFHFIELLTNHIICLKQEVIQAAVCAPKVLLVVPDPGPDRRSPPQTQRCQQLRVCKWTHKLIDPKPFPPVQVQHTRPPSRCHFLCLSQQGELTRAPAEVISVDTGGEGAAVWATPLLPRLARRVHHPLWPEPPLPPLNTLPVGTWGRHLVKPNQLLVSVRSRSGEFSQQCL